MRDMVSRRRQLGRNVACGALLAIAGLAGLVVGAWLIGIALTDRYAWSQWLWWIPTPAALLAALLGLLCALRPARTKRRQRRRLIGWTLVTGLVTIYFCFIEHHFLRTRTASPDGLHIVNLNAWHGPRAETSRLIETVLQHRGAITVLTSAGRVAWDKRLVAGTTNDIHRMKLGPFTVLTTLEIDELQPLAFTRDDVSMAMLTVHTDLIADRPVVVYLVDLPSDPHISRWSVASKVRQYIAEANAPPPDVVLGDFNITRGSASIEYMFPSFRHAYDDAGRGYAATFHRAFPLYHIDHVLLSEHWRATDYRLIDPGIGRHLMQSSHIVPNDTLH